MIRWVRALIFALVALVALSSVGCGSLGDLLSRENGQNIYGGVRWDVKMIDQPEHGGNFQRVFCILDFPFSLGMDTVLLPVTLLFAIFR